jgi:deoxyribodipyrimidine photolyase
MLSYHGSVHVSLDHPQYLVDRMLDDFPVMCREEIMDRVALIDPASYARTRNYVDGTVTRLSPYLTHGVVSVREVVDFLLSLHGLALAERLLMELVWKEFFLQVVAC